MIKKLFDYLLFFLILLYIVFEEIVWEKIAKPLFTLLFKIPFFQDFEYRIQSLNRYVTLIIFLSFFILVELLGVYSDIVFVQREIALAIFIYLLKIPLAILILWFFDINKEKLLSFYFMDVLYEIMIKIKIKITQSKAYKTVNEKIISLKNSISKLFNFEGENFKDKIVNIYNKLKKDLQ